MTRKRTRRVLVNPVAYAIEGAGRLHPEMKAGLLARIDSAVKGLQDPLTFYAAWTDMATALNVAEMLSELGICSDENSREVIMFGQNALAGLEPAPGCFWTPLTIQKLFDAIWVARTQLDYCSVSEFERAHKMARDRSIQALAGNAGPKTTIVERR